MNKDNSDIYFSRQKNLIDPSEKTCCSKSSELSYVTAAENFLRDTIRIKNAYLKKLVMDHIVQYEGKFLSVQLHA